MANLSVVQNEEQLNTALLETCEKKIMNAARRGLEATRDIGKELNKINDKHLFLAGGYKTFKDYVEERWGMSYPTAMRLIDIQHTMLLLEEAKVEYLPSNESQAAELSRIPVEYRATVWNAVVTASQSDNIDLTANFVRKCANDALVQIKEAEETEEEKPQEQPPAQQRGLDIPLDEDTERAPDANGSTQAPERIVLSEEGERALDRIRRICGESVAEALEKGTVKLNESQIVRWASEDADMMRSLVHYIIDARWSLGKALNFEQQIISASTSVEDLTTLATARGGRTTAQYKGFKISIERLAAAAA